LKPGAAFSLVQGLLWLKHPVTKEPLAEVYLISKNDPSTGFRICDAIEKNRLGIERLIFTGGEAHHDYIKELDVDLFLSADEKDVREALNDLIPAAKVLPYRQRQGGQGPLRFAFDGDAVIFSDEAERVYQTKGLRRSTATR
jgi:5'-nucleotidase